MEGKGNSRDQSPSYRPKGHMAAGSHHLISQPEPYKKIDICWRIIVK